jgi:hypothetical protein
MGNPDVSNSTKTKQNKTLNTIYHDKVPLLESCTPAGRKTAMPLVYELVLLWNRNLTWEDDPTTIYRTRGEHANHYATDAVCKS